jgi:membrane associated rhomboid family serine protease
MIPLRDATPSRTFPIVNFTLIGINVLVFFYQLAQGPAMERFVYIYGLVPARYSVPRISQFFTPGDQLFSFFSFMFLHGGFLHLIGNMWTLFIFGDNVEERLGPFRYIAFYLLCGIGSGVSHLFFNLESNIPTIGASGAIAGVMGAYFLLHPFSRILTLIPIFFIPYIVEIPAYIFLGFWFLIQFISAAGTHGAMTGIAWWAHIGGFILGMIFLRILLAFPAFGESRTIRELLARKRTPRLQTIRPSENGGELDRYGVIDITTHEARTGVSKLVNVPWGGQKRLYRIVIPGGITEGKILKMRGLGRTGPLGERGDLYLTVRVNP